jgi:NifU-like protein involved in Fe-S cluster formation
MEESSLLLEAGYPRKAIELYTGRVNVGVIENPDVALAYKGPCGDTIKLFLKIDEDNLIDEAKFQYLGCPASAACGSILTQMIKGKTLPEAKKISEDDLLRELGGLPGEECHCAKLAVTTMQKTIAKYEENKKRV